ncbi:helix-turn-helix transcriptional regulator [Oribacterium sp. oral taxon 102]|uniref:helix-turn-helix domain-containing protein n=1 Tax=Oribacterium sp. oral taxon 102 TaxID=671214 RepID=UPI0015BC0EE0|nr:helix-turn-helix transcriptional regulator [Oribacterium sp. oral taxon 102]NWO21897.1 helix-turn-helix transcriptional regulator [Oribacterium sp. oral taxon 102]
MRFRYPVIDVEKTGKRIEELRKKRGFKVREIAVLMGFQEPQAVYKWQQGKALPSLDNLFALSRLFDVRMEDIIVERTLSAEAA